MRSKLNLPRSLLYLFLVGFYSIAGGQESENLSPELDTVFHHNLRVFLDPNVRQINVENVITIPENYEASSLRFELNSDLTITDASVDVSRLANPGSNSIDASDTTGTLGANTSIYSIKNNSRSRQIRIVYEGSIYDLAEQDSEEYAQSFSETTGIIDELGVYLNYASTWVPLFGDSLITFEMEVEFADTASQWKAVSQGDRNGENGWRSDDQLVSGVAWRFRLPITCRCRPSCWSSALHVIHLLGALCAAEHRGVHDAARSQGGAPSRGAARRGQLAWTAQARRSNAPLERVRARAAADELVALLRRMSEQQFSRPMSLEQAATMAADAFRGFDGNDTCRLGLEEASLVLIKC